MNIRQSPSNLKGLRIVILISVFARGGAERQAYLLARELRERHGLDVQVWALVFDGDYAEEFQAAGIPTHVIGFRWPRRLRHWRHLCRVVRELRRGKIDVLLPFTTWPNVVAGLTYRFAGIPLCIWGERHAGGERVPFFERIAIRLYSRFVANSTAGVEFLAGEMRIARPRISLVPNGVEISSAHSTTDWRAKLGLRPGQLLVVKIANITSAKDHKALLLAWKIVQDSWRGEERPLLALAGLHGNRHDECLRVVEDTGIAQTIRFLGSIPDVPALIQAADLAAFSSRKEGMPNGVLECMAARKAVVASDLPGVRDALGPDMEAVLVPPGDSVRFAKNLLALLEDKEARARLGAENLRRIQNEFSVERMGLRHLKIIQDEWARKKPVWKSAVHRK